MLPTLTKEQKLEIAEKLKQGVPFSQIRQDYNTGNGTISRIKDKYLGKNPKKATTPPTPPTQAVLKSKKPIRSITHKQRKSAQQSMLMLNTVREADLFLSGMLDHRKMIEYAVTNLRDIQEGMKEAQDQIPVQLEKLIEAVKKGIAPKEQADVIRDIRVVLFKAKDQIDRAGTRIAVFNSLVKYLGASMQMSAQMLNLEQIQKIVTLFFGSLNLLKEAEYQMIKSYILKERPDLGHWFQQWDRTEQEIVPDSTVEAENGVS